MKAIHFINRNGIEPYFQGEKIAVKDISTIFKCWMGVMTNFVEFKHTVNDHERLFFLSHIYSYLGELYHFLRLEFNTTQGNNYVPNLWYDIKEIERLIGLNSHIFELWLIGHEFNLIGLEHNLNKLIRYLTDICICLDTRPEDVLYLYHEAYPLTAEDVKMIKLVRPTYRRVGRPSRKEQQEHDIYVNIEDYISYPEMKSGKYELTKKATKAQKKRLKVHADLYRQQKKIKQTKEEQERGWKKT